MAKDMTMADFRDRQSDEENQVKTRPVRALLAAMADVGDIEEEAGVQERKVRGQEDDLPGKMKAEEKRRSISFLKISLDVLATGTLLLTRNFATIEIADRRLFWQTDTL